MHCKTSWKSCCGKTKVRIIFVEGTVSQRTFEHIYDVCPTKKFRGGGGEVIENNKIGSFKSVVGNKKFYFLLISVERTFFGLGFLIYVHLSCNIYEIGFGKKGLLLVNGLGSCLCYIVQYFFNGMIHFLTNNVVGKPTINKCFFYIFKFVKKDSLRER